MGRSPPQLVIVAPMGAEHVRQACAPPVVLGPSGITIGAKIITYTIVGPYIIRITRTFIWHDLGRLKLYITAGLVLSVLFQCLGFMLP